MPFDHEAVDLGRASHHFHGFRDDLVTDIITFEDADFKNFWSLRVLAPSSPRPAGPKVFWFFFSKKNRFLKHPGRD
jgi:hypothetical protein